MPIIRKKLDPNTVYPSNIRYNPDTGEVESNVNGDWVPNPEADPRNQTTIPARITSDPACDAAQSVVDALKGQVDGVLTAIDNGGTAFTIAGIILSFLSFGPFGVLISIALAIADAMLDAGTTALEAALTPTVYDTLKCIIFCQFNSAGRLREGGLGIIQSQVNDQIGGLAAATLNSMLSLAGEGGINNLAALGTSTGECSGCDCEICDLDLWTHVGLGTEVERGDNYVILQAQNIPGLYGDWRVEIDTTDFDICCPAGTVPVVIIGSPASPTYKYMPCGRPFVDEGSFEHGSAPTGTEVWAVGLDAFSPFTIRFNFL